MGGVSLSTRHGADEQILSEGSHHPVDLTVCSSESPPPTSFVLFRRRVTSSLPCPPSTAPPPLLLARPPSAPLSSSLCMAGSANRPAAMIGLGLEASEDFQGYSSPGEDGGDISRFRDRGRGGGCSSGVSVAGVSGAFPTVPWTACSSVTWLEATGKESAVNNHGHGALQGFDRGRRSEVK